MYKVIVNKFSELVGISRMFTRTNEAMRDGVNFIMLNQINENLLKLIEIIDNKKEIIEEVPTLPQKDTKLVKK